MGRPKQVLVLKKVGPQAFVREVIEETPLLPGGVGGVLGASALL